MGEIYRRKGVTSEPRKTENISMQEKDLKKGVAIERSAQTGINIITSDEREREGKNRSFKIEKRKRKPGPKISPHDGLVTDLLIG